MQNYQIFTAVIALAFFVLVVVLIRRDAILISAALRWLGIAVTTVTLGFFPGIADWASSYLGIAYPPILPVLVAIVLLLAKALLTDVAHAKTQIKVDRMAQKIALLEQKIISKDSDS